MLFELLKSYVIWLLISIAVCIAGVCVTLISDPDQVRSFLISYIYYWNGLLVAASGFGALHFAWATHKQQFHRLIFGILNVTGDFQFVITAELEKLYSLRNKQLVAVPIFIVGMMILYVCGYPLTGAPQFFLWISSSLMFYAGGLMFAYAARSLYVFYLLEKNIENVRLQDDVNIIELEDFNLYLSILFLAGTLALYCAFRGTLTANFTFAPPNPWTERIVILFAPPGSNYSSVRNLLLYPIVIFLPLALFSGFHMKLVLRKIYLESIKRKISEVDALARPIIEDADSKNPAIDMIQVRKTVMELKEKIIQNNRAMPLVTLNDSPSIALTLLVGLQFIWINDRPVKSFFEGLAGTIN